MGKVQMFALFYVHAEHTSVKRRLELRRDYEGALAEMGELEEEAAAEFVFDQMTKEESAEAREIAERVEPTAEASDLVSEDRS